MTKTLFRLSLGTVLWAVDTSGICWNSSSLFDSTAQVSARSEQASNVSNELVVSSDFEKAGGA
jgi:hypothetical protein